MNGILNHFDSLLGASDVPTGRTDTADWTRLGLPHRAEEFVDDELDHPSHPWTDSVLDVYRSAGDDSSFLSAIYQMQHADQIIPNLRAILNSSRSNDEIAAELTDLLGFDEIELVMHILDNRLSVSKQGAVNYFRAHVYVGAKLDQGILKSRTPANGTEQHSQNTAGFSVEDARRRMQEQLDANAARPLFTGIEQAPAEVLPHVYTSSSMAQGNVISQLGSKYMLPIGTTRTTYEEYEEVIIPPSKPVPPRLTERQIALTELDEIVRGSFKGYTALNRIQSIVYPTAYGSNENLLVCAPTGAGKTDVAMLTILRVIDQHRINQRSLANVPVAQTIDKDAFKIIYVAPMKALASEIVRKLGKRLAWLSLEVRELTGDMQLTRAEIARTQVIVTTPEKWDVVTRKPTGEGEIASSLKLLIIDEVHLLNEDRGAVIETIVARTLRQVESSQSVIRIVGLSATLPNYRDVAEFLCVSPQKGLFYFDSSFRPVPLEQHFLGIKGKPGSTQSRKNLDTVTFRKVSELVAEGHQVMVFVHARKETVKAAMSLRELATLEGNVDDFSCEDHPQWNFHRQKIGESRNKEMKQLFDAGFGIHHAGMLRSDRNMMERMFEAKVIKVLCCTATLAWGVNLPAHAVIIKGTQVYDSAKGKFVDLSVLDVLQVFGRAGRPGLESSGEGYICTTEDKLTHYLDAVTSQIPIESQFQVGLADALNAEIALGTVANVRDAVQWLGYTYLFVRMRKNPYVYGIARDTIADDPQLSGKRNELIRTASERLANAKMITFNPQNGDLQVTDLGRIAAKYYIRHASVEIFNKEFRPKMSEADVLAMLSMSTEFEQIQVRESELKELEQIMSRVPCEVKGGTDTSAGKVNILLQGHISREMVEDFALVSDMAYVAQNAGRIVRALLEIAISKKWANVSSVLMNMSKAIETRLWPFDHPLRQFPLKAETLFSVEKWADDWTMSQLAGSDAKSLGDLIHLNEAHGMAVLNAVKQFPKVKISYTLRPVTSDVLGISLVVSRDFEWNMKVHGASEPFWIWVEDQDGLHILQLSHLLFHQETEALEVDFFIPVPQGQPLPMIAIRSISDHWMGAEDEVTISLESIIMPLASQLQTPVLDLPFLRIDEVLPRQLKDIFSQRFHILNRLQTQAFWNFVHNKSNALLCAPVGSGKSTLAQMAIWSMLLKASTGWVLVVVPTRVTAIEMASELRAGSQSYGIRLDYGTLENVFPQARSRTIRIATPAELLAALTHKVRPPIHDLRLVVCDALEQLGAEYELSLSLLRHAVQSSPVRFIGLSASLNDPADLARWLSVDENALHSFWPKDRDQSLVTSHQSFSIPYSPSLFKAMAKPAHRAIQESHENSPVLVFVPSRGQCRPIALDLITRRTLEMETARGFIPDDISEEELKRYCARFEDASLLDYVVKGVGFFYPGLKKSDRILMLEMFSEGIIRVLIVPKDSCWSVPARAPVVIVMGTQYVHVEEKGSIRQTRDYSLTELVKMQSRAVQQSGTGHFHLFCQAEALENYSKFLEEGLPLESQLHESETLRKWINVIYNANHGKQDIVDALSFTYLCHRVLSNPSYYGFTSSELDKNLSAIADQLVDELHLGNRT